MQVQLVMCDTFSMLSSDILEQQFGPTQLVVVMHSSLYRIIQTIAVNNDEVLELSLVTFDPEGIRLFPHIHKTIENGESMGKAYRNANVAFTRTVRSVNSGSLPKSLQAHFTSTGLATIVEVDVFIGEDKTYYCHVLELYSPAVDWPDASSKQTLETKKALLYFEELLKSLG